MVENHCNEGEKFFKKNTHNIFLLLKLVINKPQKIGTPIKIKEKLKIEQF